MTDPRVFTVLIALAGLLLALVVWLLDQCTYHYIGKKRKGARPSIRVYGWTGMLVVGVKCARTRRWRP